jgi:hypothetical protein
MIWYSLMQSAKDTFCRYRNVCEEELSLQGWQEVNKRFGDQQPCVSQEAKNDS